MFFALMVARMSCLGQSNTGDARLRNDIKLIAEGIAKDNVLKSEGVGIAGQRTEQWDRFEKLKNKATADELILLTDYKNAVVKCYAFHALTLRKNIDIFPILLRHINDTATVETFSGCIMSSESVGDFFLNLVTPQYIDLNAYKLTKSQRSIVDSVLLFSKTIRVGKKYELLREIKPNPKYYNRIREIAIVEKSPVAVLALARFKNIKDAELIEKLFKKEETEYYGIYSVREFPDPLFYPLLKKTFEKEWKKQLYDYPKWRMLYQALAKYPSEDTYKMFEQTALSKDEFRYQTLGQYVLVAIQKYPNKKFEPLKAKIKLDEFHQNEMKEEIGYED